MRKEGSQTNQKDPNNRGRDEADALTEQLRTLWCGREDLNLHPLQDYHLKVARVPIPPRPHASVNICYWWVVRDSNPRPPRCKRGALAN
jgi:hypothetical protein